MKDKELRAYLFDFENCGMHDSCEQCKCYEILNSTNCTVCALLLTYRKDITDRITELIDEM